MSDLHTQPGHNTERKLIMKCSNEKVPDGFILTPDDSPGTWQVLADRRFGKAQWCAFVSEQPEGRWRCHVGMKWSCGFGGGGSGVDDACCLFHAAEGGLQAGGWLPAPR